MKLSSQSINKIESALKELTKCFSASHGKPAVITDIYFQPRLGSGELFILDDDDNEIAMAVIEEWKEYNSEEFYNWVEKGLIGILTGYKEKGNFEDLSILTPYSFVLVDEDRETVAELLLMDDDTLLVSDELLKGLDKELDDFLKELLN